MGEVFLCSVHQDASTVPDGALPSPDLVAVKKLYRRLHSIAIQRLQREFALLHDLRHPGLVTVLDFHIHEQDAYLVMEYIRGKPLSFFSEKFIKQPAGIAGILEQIIDALSCIHESGIIHRDIKPSNILVSGNRDKIVKLTDFGLAFSMDPGAEIFTQSGELIGSIPYMPPELLRGLTPDPRSDLYSLGVTLFEMITGRLPFIGETPLGTMLQQINDQPPSPRSLNKQIPGWLERIVLRLLEKEREDRFQSAIEVKKTLQSKEPGFPASRKAESRVEPSREKAGLLFPSGPFAGRSLDLKHLENIFEIVLSGAGQGILISGRPGVGKSRLVKEFKRKAVQRRCLVFSSSSTVSRFSPLGAFDQVFRRIAAQPGILEKEDHRLSNLRRGIIESFLPEEEFSIFEAAGVFLSGISDRIPLVIILDNVSLQDTGTLDLFLFFLQRLTTSRILFLLVSGDEITDFDKSVGRFRIENNFGQVNLDDLDSESMFEMVRRTLAVPEMPRGFLMDLYKFTGGNPLFVRETLDLLVQEKKIVRVGKVWELKEPETLRFLPVREMMRIKLSGLTARLLQAIRICSVAGRRCEISLLSEFLENRSEAEQIVEKLVAHRILFYERNHEPESVVFISFFLRELIYETMPEKQRILIHKNIASRILSAGEPAEAGLAAFHFEKADEFLPAIEQLMETTSFAESLKSFELAISSLSRALELTSRLPDKAAQRTAELEFRIYAKRGGFLVARGRLDEGLSDFEKAGLLADSLARQDLQAIALNLSGNVLRLLARHREALKHLTRALRLNKKIGNIDGSYFNLHNLGLTYLGMGQISKSRKVFSEMADFSELNKNKEMSAVAFNSLGMLSKREGNLEEADHFYSTALKLRMDSGQTKMAAIVCNNRALVLRELAKIPDAESEYRKSIALLLEAGRRAEEAIVYNNLAEILIDRGSFVAAGEYLDRAERLASRYRDAGTESEATRNAGLLAIQKGKFGIACEKILRARELAIQSGIEERIGMADAASIRLTAALEDEYPPPEKIRSLSSGSVERMDIDREIIELSSRSMFFFDMEGWRELLNESISNETPFRRLNYQYIMGELLSRSGKNKAASTILQKVYGAAAASGLKPLADMSFLILYGKCPGFAGDFQSLREIMDRNLDEGAFGIAVHAALSVVECAPQPEALSAARCLVDLLLDSIRSLPFPRRDRFLKSGWRREVTLNLSGQADSNISEGLTEIRNLARA